MKDLKRKLLSKTIGKNAYWSLNKQLVRNIGLEATLILQHIIDLQEVFAKNEIFQSQPNMATELGISEYSVKNKIVELNKAGYITIVKKGVPCKNYYSTNDDKIIDIIVNGLDSTKSTDLLDDFIDTVETNVSVSVKSTDLVISNQPSSDTDIVSTITKNTNKKYNKEYQAKNVVDTATDTLYFDYKTKIEEDNEFKNIQLAEVYKTKKLYNTIPDNPNIAMIQFNNLFGNTE
jgi:DNA-binding Lrp family transcriptional regulator